MSTKTLPGLAVFSQIGHQGLGAPILLIMVMAMIILPLPPLLLDALFTFNIALALVVTLVTIYTTRPLEFALFPTILLVTTLMRLALNIASTRVVLISGHEGGAAAGHVIEAFGEFVIGGNYAVGLVVFAILVIINFVVVTKGSTRVSEVTARFTLDAMPGKQMAIDADLNAGVIDQEEAGRRRKEIIEEADFYGAMDGASKFVRGDAVAALLILFINIVGGLIVGVAQHGMDGGDAARVYTLLTIGDGLVAQIPALLLATAAGIIVTRVSSEQDMGDAMLSQLFSNPRALAVTGGILGILGLIPGMPNLIFLTMGMITGGLAWHLSRHPDADEAMEQGFLPAGDDAAEQTREIGWQDVAPVDRISLEVGYNLIPLVDIKRGGEMQSRIKGVRKKLSQELGFLLPSVHVRDNLELSPTAYRILLKGVTVGEGELVTDQHLAINPGEAAAGLQGTMVTDPVFGMEALWIEDSQKSIAQALGYTVVDPSTVVATHLNSVLGKYSDELLGHEEVQQLLDRVSEWSPRLVEDLVPEPLSRRVLVKVLQNLLSDAIPIRDMRSILEALAESAELTKDPDDLTLAVRVALRRSIVEQLAEGANELAVVALDPALEQLLTSSVQAAGEQDFPIEPGLAERLQANLHELKNSREIAGLPPVLLVSPILWKGLARFVRKGVPGLRVLSFDEIPEDRQIRIDSTVGGQLANTASTGGGS